MGYYINQINGKMLPAKGKGDFLLENGATEIFGKVTFCENLVCVVENVFFDAAGYTYSEFEMEHFMNPVDNRPKRWFIVPNADILSGYNKKN